MKYLIKINCLIILTILLVSWGNLYSQDKKNISGKVIGITDGDTFSLLLENDNFEIKVRLLDIDCPEKKQPYSQKAKQYVSNLIFGKLVNVQYSKKDGFGRVLGTIYVNKVNVNEEMVKAGYAWHFIKYSDNKTYINLEKEARNKKIGLWSDPNPIPPWEWRKRKKKTNK